MIDWLELLWTAAEEGEVDLLPGEAELLPVKSGGVNRVEEETDSVQSSAPEGEGQSFLRRTQNRQERAELLDPARLRSALRALNGPVGGNAADSALTALYRQVRETVSPALPGVSGRNGTVVVREEAPAAPGLTEERLDRSLRRDGRRYDGGMSIY